MKRNTLFKPLLAAALIVGLAFLTTHARAQDPLPAWNDGAAKKIHPRVRRESHHARLARLRAGAGTHRHL